MNKRKIAGLLMIILSISALGAWELWGREELMYDSIIVLKKEVSKGTLITESMLKTMKIENAGEAALGPGDVNDLIGKEAAHYIPQGTELYEKYFVESRFQTGDDIGKYILSIPNEWLKSYPQTLKRGDNVHFYLGGDPVTSCVAAYVRDSSNQEVQFSSESKVSGSANVSLIEVIVDEEQIKLLGELADKGNKFTILYD